MPNEMTLSFGLPDGRLDLRAADLDHWAEHLTWCCRLMGMSEGATIGVIDFGTSPVAFLGSAMLTPMLGSGLAERLPGRVICLDASRERVALVPSIIRQVAFDALIVRAEAVPALVTYCREADQPLDGILVITTFGMDRRDPGFAFARGRRMAVAEAGMLLAPECAVCGKLHLRHSHYDQTPEGDAVVARLNGAAVVLPDDMRPEPPGCPAGPQDWRISLDGRTAREAAA